jgi:hypothetical protein
MRATNVWRWTGLLWAVSASLAPAQEWPSPFRHLPDNTMAVVHVRVDALLKSAAGKAALAEFNKSKDLEQLKMDLGIDLAEVDGLTFVLLDPDFDVDQKGRPNLRQQRWQTSLVGSRYSPPLSLQPASTRASTSVPVGVRDEFVPVSAQAGHNSDFLPLIIVTARKAIDRKQFMRKKVDAAGGGDARMGLMFLSERSFLIGRADAVVQFAANDSEKESDLGRQLAQEGGRPPIQGGYRLAPLVKKAFVAEMQADSLVSMVFPLANVKMATFAIEFGKSADFKIRLQAANERQATLALECAKTVLAAGEATCAKCSRELEKDVADAADAQARIEAKETLARMTAIRKMASAARVEQQQTEVSVTMQVDLDASQLVRLLDRLLFGPGFPRPPRAVQGGRY